MTEECGDEYNSPDGLVVEFEINRDSYTAEAKLVFEEKINNGEIKIDVNHDGINVIVIEMSEYNREYAGKYDSIKDFGENTGNNTNLNALVINTGNEIVGFIEGSNSKQDFEDWIVNVEMAKNFSKESGQHLMYI